MVIPLKSTPAAGLRPHTLRRTWTILFQPPSRNDAATFVRRGFGKLGFRVQTAGRNPSRFCNCGIVASYLIQKPTKATMSVKYLRQSKFPSLPDPSYPSFVVRQKSTNVLLVIAANGTSLVIDLRVQIRQDKERRDTSQDTTTSNKIVRYPRSIRIASNFDLHFIEVKRKCRRL